MNHRGELQGIVRSWLREDLHESADRVLDIVLAELDTTPQRRATWPAWRFPIMNSTALRYAAAAVIAIAALALGGRLLVSNVGNQQPTVRPETTARPLPSGGDLAPGAYLISNPEWTTVPFTISVPAGWVTNGDGFVMKHAGGGRSELAFSPWVLSHIYGNACHWQLSVVDVGTSAQQVVDALAQQRGRARPRVEDTVLGGVPASRITLTSSVARDTSSCNNGSYQLWPDPGPDVTGGLASRAGHTERIYVAEIAGQRVVVVASFGANATPADRAELDGIVSSINFRP